VFPDSCFRRGGGGGGFQTVFQMSLVLPLQAKEHLPEKLFENSLLCLMQLSHNKTTSNRFCFMGYFTASVGPLKEN